MVTKSLFNAYKTDPATEVQGLWVPFPEADIEVLIARAGGRNYAYQKAESDAVAEHLETIEKMDPEEFAKVIAPAYAAHVVKGIRGPGFVGEDGQPMTYTAEVGADLLVALPDFFETVRMIARNRSVFQKAKVEAIAGN